MSVTDFTAAKRTRLGDQIERAARELLNLDVVSPEVILIPLDEKGEMVVAIGSREAVIDMLDHKPRWPKYAGDD